MSVFKYLNPNYTEEGGEPKYLTLPNLLVSDPEVHIGESAPAGDNYKIWIDTVEKVIKYNSSGTWETLKVGDM